MGVRGLTTFARDYQGAISELRTYHAAASSSSSSSKPRTTLSVDAWAWVFDVWLTHFGETVQGGNYADLIDFVKDAIAAWRACGLEPVFLWDGPMPLAKQATYVSRRAVAAANNSAFMRSSSTSRASRRFQAECAPCPPLLGDAVRSALLEEGVESIITQTEADGAVAELAEETHGLAASKDSDFFVLCSRGQGNARYTPVDTFEYVMVKQAPASPAPADSVDPADFEEDGGFQAVTKKRRRNRNPAPVADPASELYVLSRPPSRFPQDDAKLHSIRLRAFSSFQLSAQLGLPPALLPLFGSIVGNDYSTSTQDSVLFRHLHSSADRIREAADVIKREWQKRNIAAAKQAKRATASASSLEMRLAAKSLLGASNDDDSRSEYSDASSATATPTGFGEAHPPASINGTVADPVRGLVEATVKTLFERADLATHRVYFVPEAQKESCIESIIESMAAYSLLTNVGTANIHDASAFFQATLPTEAKRQALELYRSKFRSGFFSPTLISALSERIAVMTMCPEDPDQKSVHVGAARSVRRWVYAVLFEVWGMDWARESMDEPVLEPSPEPEEVPSEPATNGYKPGERPDDVISVDTESSASGSEFEPSSMTDGESRGGWDPLSLKSGPGSVIDGDDRTTYVPPSVVKPPPAVREYVRKGERLIGELVEIPKLQDLLEEADDELPHSLSEMQAQRTAFTSPPSPHVDERPRTGPSSEPVPSLTPLLPSRTRLDLYRHALHSGDAAMEAVPREVLPLATSLRHIITFVAEETGESKKRYNWTLPEVASAVRMGCHIAEVHQQRKRVAEGADRGETAATDNVPTPSTPFAPVLDRSLWVQPTARGIHLSSMLQLVMESSHMLAGALLLCPDEVPLPYTLFDGPLFHLLLAKGGKVSQAMRISKQTQATANAVLAAILDNGREDDLAIDLEELKRQRKENKRKNKELRASSEAGAEAASESDSASVEGSGKSKNKNKNKKKGGSAKSSGGGSQNPFDLLMASGA